MSRTSSLKTSWDLNVFVVSIVHRSGYRQLGILSCLSNTAIYILYTLDALYMIHLYLNVKKEFFMKRTQNCTRESGVRSNTMSNENRYEQIH